MFSQNFKDVNHGEFSIRFDNVLLYNIKSIKYLGVIWEPNLKLEVHIKYVVNKARKLLNIYNCIVRFNRGAHPSTAMMVYKQFIRPAIDWGGLVFHDANKDALKKLATIQNEALRRSLGCICTKPLNVLHHLSGVPRLKFRREYLTKRFLCSQMRFSDSMLIPKMRLLKKYIDRRNNCPQYIQCFLLKCWKKVKKWSVDMKKSRKCNCYSTEYDPMFHSRDIDVTSGYDIRNSKSPNIKFKVIIIHKFDNDKIKVIYTEGSKKGNKSGGGFCLVERMNFNPSV